MKRKNKADQLDLFAWAEAKPSNVIDAREAFWFRAALRVLNARTAPRISGKVIAIERSAA